MPLTMPRRVPWRWTALLAITGAAAAAITGVNGCSKTYTNRDPVGEGFPRVEGSSLEKREVVLPDAFRGEPAVLIVGYLQRSQFDIDRWLMGLIQAGTDAEIVEVPTIPGLTASLASGWIDDGMRSGIPEEDWGSVVTLYGDAAGPVAELTGNERGNLARVLVLDRNGQIVWFDDKGYSAKKALEVARVVRALGAG